MTTPDPQTESSLSPTDDGNGLTTPEPSKDSDNTKFRFRTVTPSVYVPSAGQTGIPEVTSGDPSSGFTASPESSGGYQSYAPSHSLEYGTGSPSASLMVSSPKLNIPSPDWLSDQTQTPIPSSSTAIAPTPGVEESPIESPNSDDGLSGNDSLSSSMKPSHLPTSPSDDNRNGSESDGPRQSAPPDESYPSGETWQASTTDPYPSIEVFVSPELSMPPSLPPGSTASPSEIFENAPSILVSPSGFPSLIPSVSPESFTAPSTTPLWIESSPSAFESVPSDELVSVRPVTSGIGIIGATGLPSVSLSPSISIGNPFPTPSGLLPSGETNGTDQSLNSSLDNGDSPSLADEKWQNKMGTRPSSRSFPVIMGILGSILVLVLLTCLCVSVRSEPLPYSYTSQYSGKGPRPGPYGSTLNGYNEDRGFAGAVVGGAGDFHHEHGPNSVGEGTISENPRSGAYDSGTMERTLAPDPPIDGPPFGRTSTPMEHHGATLDAAIGGAGGAMTGYESGSSLNHGSGRNIENEYPHPHPYGDPYGVPIYGSSAKSDGFANRGESARYVDGITVPDGSGIGELDDGLPETGIGNQVKGDQRNIRTGRSVQFADELQNSFPQTDLEGTVGLVDRGDYYYGSGSNPDVDAYNALVAENDYGSRNEFESGDYSIPQEGLRTGEEIAYEEPDPYQATLDRSCDDNEYYEGVSQDYDDGSYRGEYDEYTIDEAQRESRNSQTDYEKGDIFLNDTKENSAPSESLMSSELKSPMKAESENGFSDGNRAEMFGSRLVLGDTDWRNLSLQENANEKMLNPDFEYLRRLREPYVKSVAGRLSTGALSCTTATVQNANSREY